MHDELQRHNRVATIALLVGGFLILLVVAVAVQLLLFGATGELTTTVTGLVPVLLVGVGVAGVGSAVAWWTSDRVALASTRARPADAAQYPDYHRLVEGLSLAANLPKPELYVIEDPAPNAFATGRNPEHAAIAVTTGLLEGMERRELEAVLAHELGHVVNDDLLTVTVAVTLAGATILLADLARRALWWGGMGGRRGGRGRGGGGGGVAGALLLVASLLVIVFAPLAAQLIRFAVSRQREYLADATSVELTRDPASMIAALERLRGDTTEIRTATRATAHLWIEEPLSLSRRANRLVATHPPLDDRIDRLRRIWPSSTDPDTGPTETREREQRPREA